MIGILMLCMGNSVVADEIVVPNVIIPKGGTATLDIQLNNDRELTPTFSFYLRLPDGITVVDDSKKLGERFNSTSATPLCEPDGERYYILVQTIANIPIPGESGTLITLDIEADESVDEGAIQTGYVEDIEFLTWYSDKSGEDANIQSPVDFQITIGQPDDGRLKFYETSTTLPPYTAGEKANVTMYRTIKANEWSTICLPFTLPKAKAEAVFGSDVEIYKYKDYTATIEDPDVDVTPTAIQINFTKHELKNSLSSIAGGTPYLIKTSRNIESFEVDDVKLVGDVSNIAGGDTEYGDVLGGYFRGSFVKTTIPTDGLFISENSFWYSAGKTKMKAFRAWFELGAVLNKEVELSRIVFGFDDTTTGITTNNDNYLENDNTYDLQGRRVVKPAKGLYIKNGRKEVVR